MIDFNQYRALSFDCYGTLIDWEAGIGNWGRAWLQEQASALPVEEFVRAFGTHERDVQAENPSLRYPLVLAEVLRRIGKDASVSVSDTAAASFGESVGDWPAFDDSAMTLKALKERYKLVILSNVDRSSFARSNDKLGVKFDAVVTAEDVGSYKPDKQNFDTLLATVDGMGVLKHQLLHVGESIFHDIAPAHRDGIDVVWINRGAGRPGPRASGEIDAGEERPRATYPSMQEFAKAALLS